MLALSLLKDADDDVLCRDSSDPNNIILKTGAESERLKANALSFFFSKESEPFAQTWCDDAGQSLKRFRRKLEKYRK